MNEQIITIEPAAEVNPFAERLAAQDGAPAKVRPKTGILAQVTTRKRRRPPYLVIYGPPGAGKSTVASKAPKPIFIQTERGLDQITVDRLPIPKDFRELWDQIVALDSEEHDYETIVVDTLDAVELLIWQRVCQEGKCKSIEDYAGGYGKGFTRAREIFTGLLNKLSEMSERFTVVLICHSHVKTISDPMLGTAYDTHKMRLQDKSVEIVRQVVDGILFVQLDMTIQKDNPKARKGRGIVSGDRYFWTQPSTGIEAKNRWNLPNPLEFSWEALEQAINDFYNR